MRLFFAVILMLLLAGPVLGADKPDCADALRASIYGPAAVVRGMADYKAAMDAGYEGCSAKDAEAFGAVAGAWEMLRGNTEKELERGLAALDHLIENPGPEKTPKGCLEDAKAQEVVKKDVRAAIEGQYEKAYERRLKILAAAAPEAEGRDSCGLVLDMLDKYGKHYKRNRRLRNVLYESSKRQDRTDRRVLKNFEKAREEVSR